MTNNNNTENLKLIASLVKLWYKDLYTFSKNNLFIAKINIAYKKKHNDLYKKLKDFIGNFNHSSLIVTLANKEVEWIDKDELHYADFFKNKVDNKLTFGDLMDYTKIKKTVQSLDNNFDCISKHEIDFNKTSLLKNKIKINSKLMSYN